MGFQVGVKIDHPLRAQGIQALLDGRIIFFPKRDRRIFKQHAVALFVLLQRIGRAFLLGDIGYRKDDPGQVVFMTGCGKAGDVDLYRFAGQGLVFACPAKPGFPLRELNQFRPETFNELGREDLDQAA